MGNIPGLKVACDPEFFLVDAGGEIVSAAGLLGGSKESPRPVPYGQVLEDNIMAEIGIDPATTAEEFTNNIQAVMGELRKIVAAYGLDISITPSAKISKELLDGDGADEIGCAEEFNGYTGELYPQPHEPDLPYRFCGGHIHVSHPVFSTGFIPHKKMAALAARIAETRIGEYVEGEFDHFVAEKKRNEFYGRPAAFRPTEYPDGSKGFEYRTPSNLWTESPTHHIVIFKLVEKVMDDLFLALDMRGLKYA